MEAILTVTSKVAVMLLLILVGYVVARRGVLTEKGTAEVNSLLIKVVTPCLLIHSLLGSGGDLALGELALAVVAAALSMVLGIGVSLLFFRKKAPEQQKVLRFSVIFSNAGFMGLPLVQAIVGPRGVVFASLFIVTFNVICWTYGYAMMTGAGLNVKSALLNPGMIGLAIGLPLYLLRVELPAVLGEPIAFLAGLNTPLAMIVIGSNVARVDLKDALGDRSVYEACFLRLVAVPALFLGALLLIRPEHDLFLSSAIQVACPVAANCVLFATEYHRDEKLASKTVAVSTVLSILTIPLFTVAAKMLYSIS